MGRRGVFISGLGLCRQVIQRGVCSWVVGCRALKSFPVIYEAFFEDKPFGLE
jgi:hypothetical protein